MSGVVIAMDGVDEAMKNLRDAFGDNEESIRRIVLFRVDRLLYNAKTTKHPSNAVRMRQRAQQYLNAINP